MTSGLSLQRVGDTSEALEALVATTEGRVGLADLLDDLPRRLRRTAAPGRAVHEAWWLDPTDQVGLRWWPQGVTTAGDAGAAALPPGVRGRRIVMTSSYAKQLPWHDAKHGSRITLMDLDRGRYRHVLLVRPTADGGLEPLRVHAGGVLWHGDYVHVAATARGLFTCRLDDVLRVRRPEDALGYRYVLPIRMQHRGLAADGVDKLRYSFLSLDHASWPPSVLAGEHASLPTATRRTARFALEPATGLPAGADGRTPVELVGDDGPLRTQGVVEARGLHLRSISQLRYVPGSLYVGPDPAPRHHRWAVPNGNEDLSFWPEQDLVYGVSEHPGTRWLYTVKRSWLD